MNATSMRYPIKNFRFIVIIFLLLYCLSAGAGTYQKNPDKSFLEKAILESSKNQKNSFTMLYVDNKTGKVRKKEINGTGLHWINTKNLLQVSVQTFNPANSGSTYTPTVGTTFVKGTVIGGGGQGGGVVSNSGTFGAGGGGGAGSAVVFWDVVAAISGQVITVGGPGNSAAPGAAGAPGAASSVGNIVIVGGGDGGDAMSAVNQAQFAPGGDGGTITINVPDVTFTAVQIPGPSGGIGMTDGITWSKSGMGANTIFGAGGAEVGQTGTDHQPGLNATGLGAGGSGSTSSDTTNTAGGFGQDGIVIIEEFQ